MDATRYFRNESLQNETSYEISNDFNLQEETLYLDILKDLYSEFVDMSKKLESLRLLQDESSFLLNNNEKVEQVIGSLHSLFKQTLSANEYFFSGQILITVTIILITATDSESESFVLVTTHRDFLLSIAAKSNQSRTAVSQMHPIISSTAYQCLQELEIHFPGMLLESCLNQIIVISKVSKESFEMNSSVNLLSVIIKNFNNSANFSADIKNSTTRKDLLSLVFSIIDILPFLPATSFQLTIHNIIQFLLKVDPTILSTTLKTWLPQLVRSTDISLLHLSIFIRHSLSLKDFENNAYLETLEQISLISKQALLPVAQRLLLMDWLEYCYPKELVKTDIPYLTKFAFSWLPGPFDGTDISTKKLRILMYSLPQSELQRYSSNIVSCLRKLITNSSKSARLVFRTIFLLSSRKSESKSLENHICMLSILLLEHSGSLIIFLIDLIRSIKKESISGDLIDLLWNAILFRMNTLPCDDSFENIQIVILCLNHANIMNEPVTRIRGFLECITRLLISSESVRHNWIIGHALLASLTSLLKRPDVGLLYYSLGKFLHILLSKPTNDNEKRKMRDVDVASRAKYCYAALTSLTPSKVHQLFISDGKVINRPLVSGGNTGQTVVGIPQESPQINTCESFFNLERVNLVGHDEAEMFPKQNFGGSGALDSYLESLTQHQHIIPVSLKIALKCKPVEEKFMKLYALIVNVYFAQNACIFKSDNIIATLLYGEDETFNFDIVPLKSGPIHLKFSIEFTTACGESFLIPISNYELILGLPDIIKPLPNCSSDAKLLIFQQLWDSIEVQWPSNVCIHFMPIDEKILLTKWESFLIDKTDLETKVGLFVAPNSHILLRWNNSSMDGVQITFATDKNSLLPWLNVYLQQLCS